jgi:hypothetical protein
MGYGHYSVDNRLQRSARLGYHTKSRDEIFSQRSINNAMNPYNIKIRESRDSPKHPNSLSIILGLDVTGSMGSIPHFLVQNGLPQIMGKIIQSGVADPQILFLGIGDHQCDTSPLQVGQFESSDELLDQWLTDVYLEGGGGGNEGESYLLAWYFASFHTSIDCYEKRHQKGLLFTIGDEPVLKKLPARDLQNIMGDGQYADFSANALLEKSSERYNVFHIHVKETMAGKRQETIDGWKQLMWDNLIIAEHHAEISNIIADTVLKHNGLAAKRPSAAGPADGEEEIIL